MDDMTEPADRIPLIVRGLCNMSGILQSRHYCPHEVMVTSMHHNWVVYGGDHYLMVHESCMLPALAVKEELEREARERQATTQFGSTVKEIFPEPSNGQTRDKIIHTPRIQPHPILTKV